MKQKEFAARDYAGLDEVGKKRLREYRDNLAKDLNRGRNKINSELAENTKNLTKSWRSEERFSRNAETDL